MKLSVVTTLYNSSGTVMEFYRRASAEASAITDDYEIVMIDDGSPDDSLAKAKQLAESDSRVTVVELSRNFGHHKALMTGLDHAKGDYVFLIDSDLEEDPALLSRFFEEMQKTDADVIYGLQQVRQGNFVKRRLGRVAWSFIERLYSVHIPRNQCTVRLMRREYVDALLLHRERNTVIGGLWVITGFHQLGLPIQKHSRSHSSYSLAHRFATLIDGVTSFSTRLLIGMIYFGFAIVLLDILVTLWVLIQAYRFNTASGWASLLLSLWFLGGVIIMSIGIVGLYVSKIYLEVKNRPYVIVRRIHGGAKDVG